MKKESNVRPDGMVKPPPPPAPPTPKEPKIQYSSESFTEHMPPFKEYMKDRDGRT